MADNSKTKDNDDLLKLYNEKILKVGISTSGKSDEIVDIISDYPWSVQQFSQRVTDANKTSYTHNIPFCYAIERMQTVNSTVANIINSLLGSSKALLAAGKEGMKNMGNRLLQAESAKKQIESKQGEGTASGGTTSTPPKQEKNQTEKKETPQNKSDESGVASLMNFLSSKGSILDHISSLGDDMANAITPRLAESNMANSEFLYPWRWHYFTRVTGKKFVFPAFKPDQLLKTAGQWGGSDPNSGKITDMFKDVIGWFEKGAEIAYAFKNFTDFLPQEGEAKTYENFNMEKAMGYTYNAGSGEEFSCTFVLYNTTKKDAWKKNYRFITMFILRNLPLRTTMYSIKPPLLYDVIVPGIKHLPLCYVSKTQIDSLGHVRTMSADNPLQDIVSSTQNTKTLVPVPEAWKVQITFKNLIPNTMNLILNTTNFPINVTTVSK